jgi:hypothetical protein
MSSNSLVESIAFCTQWGMEVLPPPTENSALASHEILILPLLALAGQEPKFAIIALLLVLACPCLKLRGLRVPQLTDSPALELSARGAAAFTGKGTCLPIVLGATIT